MNNDIRNTMDRLNELGPCSNWVRVGGDNTSNRLIVADWDNGISPCGKFKAVVVETGVLGLVHNNQQ